MMGLVSSFALADTAPLRRSALRWREHAGNTLQAEGDYGETSHAGHVGGNGRPDVVWQRETVFTHRLRLGSCCGSSPMLWPAPSAGCGAAFSSSNSTPAPQVTVDVSMPQILKDVGLSPLGQGR